MERAGHDRGYLQFRWQRLSTEPGRELTASDGPTMEIVKDADVPSLLPFHDTNTVTPQQWAERIAARQTGVARRMLG